MEPVSHLHGPRELPVIMGVKLTAIRKEPRYLPSLVRIFEDEGVIYPQILGHLLSSNLSSAVYQPLRPNARMPIDVFA